MHDRRSSWGSLFWRLSSWCRKKCRRDWQKKYTKSYDPYSALLMSSNCSKNYFLIENFLIQKLGSLSSSEACFMKSYDDYLLSTWAWLKQPMKPKLWSCESSCGSLCRVLVSCFTSVFAAVMNSLAIVSMLWGSSQKLLLGLFGS